MGHKLGVSRNLVSMMESADHPRQPSRTVRLNFGHVLAEALRCGAITPEDFQRITGENPTESELPEGITGTEPAAELRATTRRRATPPRMIPLLDMDTLRHLERFDPATPSRAVFPAIGLADELAFAFTVQGEGMAPDFKPGDIATAIPGQAPRNGGVVIARLVDGGDVLLRVYQAAGDVVTLSAYSVALPPMTFPRSAFSWIYPVASVTRLLF